MKLSAMCKNCAAISRRMRQGPPARLWVLTGLALAWLVGCTVSPRPVLPVEVLLTPAVLPTPAVDGEAIPFLPPDAAAGAAIYEQQCVACHGPDGKGNGPQAAVIRAQGRQVPSLVESARARAVSPGEWHRTITVGRIQNLMPGFSGSLNGQQRWDVLAYVWALGTSPQTLEAGKRLYAQQCAACHGDNGEKAFGEPARAFNDTRFVATYSLLEIANLMQRGEAHQGVQLSEAERFQVADVVRSFGYRYADPQALRLARTNGDGSIALQVVNGTPGGKVPSEGEVVLRVYDAAGEVFSRTATLDASNTVTFTNLPRRETYFYQAELTYAGGTFYAAPIQLTEATTGTVRDVLPIFETTEDDAQVRLREVHFFVQAINEGSITMVEFYTFDNLSDRAYIGKPGPDGKRRTLKLSRPAQARNLRFDGLGLGQRFFEDGDALYDTDVVIPAAGATQIAMLYEVPYRDQFAFERMVFYPTDAWDVLLPDFRVPGEPLRVVGLQDRGLQQLSSGSVRVFVGRGALQPGDVMRFRLEGRVRGAPQPGADGRALGFGLLTLGLAVGLVYFLLMRARAIGAEQRAMPLTKQGLLSRIARLDEDYAQGKITETSYREQRALLKSLLREVWEVEDAQQTQRA